MATAILQCVCEHIYQDKKYGKGQRVHNETGPKKGTKYRCTVCKRER